MKYQIPGTPQAPQLLSHRFAQPPPDAIPNDCFSESARHRKANPAISPIPAITPDHGKTASLQLRPFFVNQPEILAPQYPARLRKC
jgi:hypothetical protein